MYLASLFNDRGLFQYLNGWVSQVEGEARAHREAKVEEVYFRATSVLIALDRMEHMDEACVREFEAFESECEIKDDRIVFWSPRLVGMLNELPATLSALRIMQNALLPTFTAGRRNAASVPSSLHDAIKKAHQIALPDEMKSRVLDYWHRGGNRLKDYRDVDQHFGAVVRHTFLRVEPPRHVSIFLPDNPEAKKSKDFTFNHELDAHAFVRDSFQNLHSVYEELARLDGAARGALQQSIGMSQLGELVEGVQKTLCMSVDGDPPDHAFVVGQTEDRRVSVKQVYPAGSVAA